MKPKLKPNLGQVFTPQEIINYMVDESYKERLKNGYSGELIRILEPACGDGRFVKRLLEVADEKKLNVRITAVDIDEEWINWCKEEYKDSRVRWICGNTLLMGKKDLLW